MGQGRWPTMAKLCLEFRSGRFFLRRFVPCLFSLFRLDGDACLSRACRLSLCLCFASLDLAYGKLRGIGDARVQICRVRVKPLGSFRIAYAGERFEQRNQGLRIYSVEEEI